MHSTENGSESGGDQASTARTTLSVSAGATPVSVSSTPNTLSTNGSASIVRECAGCGKRIVDRFLLKALDLFWHEDCLKCGCCDCRLGEVGSTLYTKANLILCKRDYLRLFGTTGYCAACNKVIPAFEMVMRAKNNVYHLECFACQQCNHRFCVGDRFYLCENKILCEYDYEERLVFANMAYNPSSLAHIRRQVSNLQPPPLASGDNLTPHEGRIQVNNTTSSCYSEKNSDTAPGPQRLPISPNGGGYGLAQRPHDGYQPTDGCPLPAQRLPLGAASDCCPITAQRNQATRDDGSSGYGSPDSETFEAQLPMHHQ